MTAQGEPQRDWTGPEIGALQSLYRQDRRIIIRNDEGWQFDNVADFVEFSGRSRRAIHGQACYLRSKGYDFPRLAESRPWTDDETAELKRYMLETPRRSNIEVGALMGRSKQAIANRIHRLKAQGAPCNPVDRPKLTHKGIMKRGPDSLERRTFDVCGYWYGSAAYVRERMEEKNGRNYFNDYHVFRVYRWLPNRQRTNFGEYDTRAEADERARELNEQAIANAK